MPLPVISVFPKLLLGASPCGQRLPDGALPQRISLRAVSSRLRFATGTSARSCSPVLVCIFPMALCHGASPCGQHLPDGYPPQCCQSLRHGAPTSIFPMTLRYGATTSVFLMALCHGGASHKALCHSAPASNKPHPAEKSTPVWLAIWHIWAGFANSQLHCATFHSTYSY